MTIENNAGTGGAADGAGGGRGAEIVAALPRMAAAAGVDLPAESGGTLPVVSTFRPLASVCLEVGQILHSAPIFRWGRDFVTVDEATGETEPMDVMRFRSWYQRYFHFESKHTDGVIVGTCQKDNASCILASDEVVTNVRPLVAVHPVRLPVWRGDGSDRTIELLPAGYDAPTGIFSMDSVTYPEDVTLADAVAWFCDVLGEFPWHEGGELMTGRSCAAQVAVMVGTFCKGFFPPGTIRPLVVYNGNRPGAGKSKLARMALAPVFGAAEEASKPEESALRDLLDTAAYEYKPYLFLDDVLSLKSTDLNRFITSPRHMARVKGKTQTFRRPAVTQVFASGNRLLLTPDLEQRALVVDLFASLSPAERKLRREIVDEWLWTPDYRRPALAALWALVRHWRDEGMPIPEEARHGRAPSFGRWIGAIVMAAGFANPFAPRAADVAGGNESGRALELVIADLAAQIPYGAKGKDADLTTTQILDELAERELLDVVFPHKVQDNRKALGKRLANLRGQQFVDTRGRRFEFGRRGVMSGAAYTVTFIDSGPDVAQAPPAGSDADPF